MSSQQWALPRINQELCIRCGLCADCCPGHAVDMAEDGPAFARPTDCTYCAECEEACPTGAIQCEFVVEWEDEKETNHGETTDCQDQ